MLKKYIQIFLETANFQNQQPTSPSYREIARQIEDQYRIDSEKAKKRKEEEENIDIEKYSNLLNYSNRNVTPARNLMFTKKPKKRT